MKSFTILLIVFPTIAYSLFSTNRHVNVVLENLTGQPYNFQVFHKNKNGTIDSFGWRTFAPSERNEVFSNVQYKTGLFVFGSDSWKVVGTPLEKMNFHKNPKSIIGKPTTGNLEYSTLWHTHKLQASDDNRSILIRVLPNVVNFISKTDQSYINFVRSRKMVKRML